ncbi:unnamed protein product [Rotaria sp. Silwood1]|nr:unnamed protein product [Rotaria sp. Silwood1]CAF4640990.1 unnamed protein product [Rotaria sp. Silwood1]CAF4851947.1 unnamed protein product [Rotaria sp. Silwood1]
MADINNIARNSTTIDSVLISQEYTTEKITNLLRTKNSDYRVIDNESGLSQVWTSFGLPAKTNELGHVHIIYGFASCKECKLTYSYESSKIGTTPLQRHICANKKTSLISTTRPTKKQRSSSCSSSSASTIIKINDTDTLFNFGIQKQITGTTKEIDTLKTLMVQWICGSLRPVSIVEDQGFIKLLQFAVNLGSKYNSFDINCLLRKRSVITNEITTVARQHREALKEQLTEPYLNRSLTLMPDIWKDKRNSLSFLGCSVVLVDNNFQFITFDLFCKEFEEPNQRFMSIINIDTNSMNYNEVKSLNDLPADALSFIQTIKHIKSVVKYVKKAHINSDIKKISNTTLKQCTKVRWLSLYSTIDSFNKCYDAVKIVLKTRPHAAVIQINRKPSLHLGVLSLLKLKQVYSSAKKLDSFYRNQVEKKNKKEANVQHQQVVVNIDGDDEENEFNDESSDNADDDEYAFESPGILGVLIDNAHFVI